MGWMVYACRAEGGACRAGNGSLFAFSPLFSFRLAALFAHREFFFSLFLAYPRASVRPTIRWLHSTTYLPARLSAAMAALALAAIEAAMSGVLAWTSDFA
jgi:hypothetical protein